MYWCICSLQPSAVRGIFSKFYEGGGRPYSPLKVNTSIINSRRKHKCLIRWYFTCYCGSGGCRHYRLSVPQVGMVSEAATAVVIEDPSKFASCLFSSSYRYAGSLRICCRGHGSERHRRVAPSMIYLRLRDGLFCRLSARCNRRLAFGNRTGACCGNRRQHRFQNPNESSKAIISATLSSSMPCFLSLSPS